MPGEGQHQAAPLTTPPYYTPLLHPLTTYYLLGARGGRALRGRARRAARAARPGQQGHVPLRRGLPYLRLPHLSLLRQRCRRHIPGSTSFVSLFAACHSGYSDPLLHMRVHIFVQRSVVGSSYSLRGALSGRVQAKSAESLIPARIPSAQNAAQPHASFAALGARGRVPCRVRCLRPPCRLVAGH